VSILPGNDSSFADIVFEESQYPTKSYYMDFENKRIVGTVDGLEAMGQVIDKIINTERSMYQAYSDNYGIEFIELLGMPVSYVLPELKRCLIEALTWDERIDSVDNFEFEVNRGQVHVTFTVHTVYGDVDAERTVDI
jgi:hypothetical protein